MNVFKFNELLRVMYNEFGVAFFQLQSEVELGYKIGRLSASNLHMNVLY